MTDDNIKVLEILNKIEKNKSNVSRFIVKIQDDYKLISEDVDNQQYFNEDINSFMHKYSNNINDILKLLSDYTGVNIPEPVTNNSEIKKDSKIREYQHKYKIDEDMSIPHDLMEDFAGSTPCAFSLNGEKIEIEQNWKGLYIRFLQKLYSLDKELLLSVADNDNFKSRSGAIYFTSDPRNPKIRSIREVIPNIFYVETNLGTREFKRRIADLLRLFNFSLDSIKIYLKNSKSIQKS